MIAYASLYVQRGRERRDLNWCESKRRFELGQLLLKKDELEYKEKERLRLYLFAEEQKLKQDFARKLWEKDKQHQHELNSIESMYINKLHLVAKEAEVIIQVHFINIYVHAFTLILKLEKFRKS